MLPGGYAAPWKTSRLLQEQLKKRSLEKRSLVSEDVDILLSLNSRSITASLSNFTRASIKRIFIETCRN